MNLKTKILQIICLILVLSVFIGNSQAATLFSENFEYNRDSWGWADTFSVSGWKWNDYNDWGGVFGVSSLHSHTGTRSLLMNFLPYTLNTQTDLHIQKNGDFGSNVWIQEWMYIAYEPGMYSGFEHQTQKWIYAYNSNYSHSWCIALGTTRFTDTDSYNQEHPLPNDHTGIFFYSAGDGCATIMSGQNLSNHYMPVNRWSRLIVHINTSIGASPNIEAWIDDENGNLTKVAQHTSTLLTQGFSTERIKFGTTFGTYGGTNHRDSWIFVDDIVIANSPNDMDWSSGENIPKPVIPKPIIISPNINNFIDFIWSIIKSIFPSSSWWVFTQPDVSCHQGQSFLTTGSDHSHCDYFMPSI